MLLNFNNHQLLFQRFLPLINSLTKWRDIGDMWYNIQCTNVSMYSQNVFTGVRRITTAQNKHGFHTQGNLYAIYFAIWVLMSWKFFDKSPIKCFWKLNFQTLFWLVEVVLGNIGRLSIITDCFRWPILITFISPW